MIHHLLFGLILGWGAAIPIGPINVEIIRRNLNFGTRYGVAFGAGACSADVTYVVLFSLGLLFFLTNITAMKVVSVLGSLILLWFAFQALVLKANASAQDKKLAQTQQVLLRHFLDAYFLTLFNPYTIAFWVSVSAQVTTMARGNSDAVYTLVLGVLLGAFSWALGLNIVLHFTRHRLPQKALQYLNFIGGIILLVFAVVFLLHAFV